MAMSTRIFIAGLSFIIGAAATALLAAVVLALVDLYLTGHGAPSLMQSWFEWGSVVRLSRADVVLYLASVIGGSLSLFAAGRLMSPRTRHHPDV